MKYTFLLAAFVLALFSAESRFILRAAPLDLRDGDRVVLLGGTYIERMQTYGYIETLLTCGYSDQHVTFRNLGWSGDDVTGLARAVFGRPADGFARLERDLIDAKPTVVVVCYGGNEAHSGETGLADFKVNLARLLDVIGKTQARIVLLSPMSHENAGPPLPNPMSYNVALRKYCEATAGVAKERGHTFVDLYNRIDAIKDVSATPAIRNRLTDNGIHLNEFGYWRTSFDIARRLGMASQPWKVDLDLRQQIYDATGTAISQIEMTGKSASFVARDRSLPYSPAPQTSPRGGNLSVPHSVIRIRGLEPGKYGLQIDGQPTVLASQEQWAEGIHIYRAEYLPQVEKLRAAIQKKNELYFHRHRPQNETYLFLFRKHEQGNNAVEIPKFDPLIAEQEKQIAKLKMPRTNIYKLVQIEAAKKDATEKDSTNEN